MLETVYVSATLLHVILRVDDAESFAAPAAKSDDKEKEPAPVELQLRVTGAGQQSEPFSIRVELSPIAGMTVVPAGPFIYGSDEGSSFERPARRMMLPQFACAMLEVSNYEYLEFLNHIQETGDHSLCHADEPPQHSHVPDRWDDPAIRLPTLPVTGVDWFDAYSYAAWRGRRLPSEEEWEKAARGIEGESYPWGEKPDSAMANTAVTRLNLQAVTHKPEGRSPFGLYNAAGNVWEWTAGEGPAAGQMVIRGGSFRTDMKGCRAFVRNWLDRTARRDDVGFRCATDV
ncbi:MAG TPA: SUMF1/EgtB/PvdO family nonheme iron enzyme [Acidobacteriota bacterium]|nr:SUMF1/EgtB/PvdO family nonheme iron enzyme [Acidobacteriota bacterium]